MTYLRLATCRFQYAVFYDQTIFSNLSKKNDEYPTMSAMSIFRISYLIDTLCFEEFSILRLTHLVIILLFTPRRVPAISEAARIGV